MKKIALAVALSALFVQQTNAMDVQPYVGGDYIYSWADVKPEKYIEDNYHSLSISAGVMTSSVVGIELSYQLSEQNKKTTSAGQTKFEYKALALDGAYYMSLNDNIQGIGTLGLGYYDINAKVKSGGVLDHDDDEHFGLRFGAGLQYSIDSNWAVRMMARYHYIDAKRLHHITDITAGVRYYF